MVNKRTENTRFSVSGSPKCVTIDPFGGLNRGFSAGTNQIKAGLWMDGNVLQVPGTGILILSTGGC